MMEQRYHGTTLQHLCEGITPETGVYRSSDASKVKLAHTHVIAARFAYDMADKAGRGSQAIVLVGEKVSDTQMRLEQIFRLPGQNDFWRIKSAREIGKLEDITGTFLEASPAGTE